MRLRPEQLPDHLKQTLMPVYLVTGDEPLQVMEACDQVRTKAIKQGFPEREILSVESGFDWGSLHSASSSLSLFAEKKLLDLRLPTGKPGQQGSKALQAYLQQPPEDKVLLIQAGKLDGNAKNAAWFKAIDQQGIIIQVWDLSPPQTMAWVAKRMREKGLHPSQEAVHLLTERVEGNLLAAAQEIDKLFLLFGQTEIDEEKVLAAVTDSSRFSIFDLGDAVLLGDTKRIQHILQVLKEEDTAIQLILWAMTDISRQFYQQAHGVQSNRRLPKNRQAMMQQALHRANQINWQAVWHYAAEIDRESKGVGFQVAKHADRIWNTISDMSLELAGKPTLPQLYA
jgi:DNA polymerase-3 subunit delta